MTEKVITIKIKGLAVQQLEELRKKVNATSNAEVVKDALRVYNTIINYKDVDGSLIIETPKGERVRLILP